MFLNNMNLKQNVILTNKINILFTCGPFSSLTNADINDDIPCSFGLAL